LAEALDWDWIDADVEIERVAGKTVAKIFSEDGEPAFRDWESRVIAEFCMREKLVLATGGGAPMREENRKALRAAGKVVWLTATPETILARMTGDATTPERRPALTDRAPLDEIVQLLARREPIYRDTADLVLDTEKRSPAELAGAIIEAFRLKNS
jgi:shikimate kinase